MDHTYINTLIMRSISQLDVPARSGRTMNHPNSTIMMNIRIPDNSQPVHKPISLKYRVSRVK